MSAIRTTCPYCGVGCGVRVNRDGSIAGDLDRPANLGRLCSKGAALGESLGLADRLLRPQIDGRMASWDEALDHIAARFTGTIAVHGPDAVALYVSGQFLTEDYYVANKLMKGFIGSGNIDTNSRLCMASSVAGHIRAFGEDIVPGCYDDIDQADLVVLVGSNAAWCHPVLYQRLAAAKAARRVRAALAGCPFVAVSDCWPSDTTRFAPNRAAPRRAVRGTPAAARCSARDQWHTMTRTGRVPRLMTHVKEPLLDINPQDAARLGLGEGGLARVESRYGSVVLRVRLSSDQRCGEVFAPMHWTDQFSSAGPITGSSAARPTRSRANRS
jgi:anaerobic selenocysteine-containing dehydrogenase